MEKIETLEKTYKKWIKNRPKLPKRNLGIEGSAKLISDGDELRLIIANNSSDGTHHKTNISMKKAKELYNFLHEIFS